MMHFFKIVVHPIKFAVTAASMSLFAGFAATERKKYNISKKIERLMPMQERLNTIQEERITQIIKYYGEIIHIPHNI